MKIILMILLFFKNLKNSNKNKKYFLTPFNKKYNLNQKLIILRKFYNGK